MTPEELALDPYVAAFPEIAPFWQAAARGSLVLPRCTQCGQTHWHPRAQCPFCRAEAIEWHAASGRATLHTFTEIQRADGNYVLAYAQLEEGPLVLTNIVDADAAALRIGASLQVAFRPAKEGRTAPVFRPC